MTVYSRLCSPMSTAGGQVVYVYTDTQMICDFGTLEVPVCLWICIVYLAVARVVSARRRALDDFCIWARALSVAACGIHCQYPSCMSCVLL
jgi:hypothetical protein